MAIKWNIDLVRKFVEENGNGDELVSDVYKNFNARLIFKCHACGKEYEATFDMFHSGYYHRECTRKINYAYIVDYLNKNKNGDTLVSTEYINNTSELTFNCHICHKNFDMTWMSYQRGYRHDACMRKIGNKHRRLSEEYVIQHINQKGCKLLSEYNGVDKNMKILFSCGHEDERTFAIFKKSLPICSRCIGNKKYNFKEVIDEMLLLGFIVDENQEYKNSKTVIKFLDNDGYKYFFSFNYIKSALKRGNEIGKFCKQNIYSIENMRLWLKINNKNWTFTCEEYKGSDCSNLMFECNVCNYKWHAAWARIYNLGTGCPNCSIKPGVEKARASRIKDDYNVEFLYPFLAKEWDYDKNENSPEKYTPYSNFKVFWKCSACCGEWQAAIYSRVSGNGCPICGQSGGEKKIYYFLKNNGLIFDKEHTFNDLLSMAGGHLRYDFAILENNNVSKLIEFDGRQHEIFIPFIHKTLDAFYLNKEHDEIKNNYAKEHNIPLLRIKEKDYKNIEQILTKELNLLGKEA